MKQQTKPQSVSGANKVDFSLSKEESHDRVLPRIEMPSASTSIGTMQISLLPPRTVGEV